MPFLTAHELAKELKVTVDTVWRYTRKGKIPSIRLGPREYRYCLEEVVAALREGIKDEPTSGPSGTEDLRPSDPARLHFFAGEAPAEVAPENGR